MVTGQDSEKRENTGSAGTWEYFVEKGLKVGIRVLDDQD